MLAEENKVLTRAGQIAADQQGKAIESLRQIQDALQHLPRTDSVTRLRAELADKIARLECPPPGFIVAAVTDTEAWGIHSQAIWPRKYVNFVYLRLLGRSADGGALAQTDAGEVIRLPFLI